MPGIFKNQAVAYTADPSLYGQMHVLELKDGFASAELDSDGTMEVFSESELVAAASVWGDPSLLTAIGPPTVVIPDAPPDDM